MRNKLLILALLLGMCLPVFSEAARNPRMPLSPNISINEEGPNRTAFVVIVKNVTTAGTPELLSASSVIVPDGFSLLVKAKNANTGKIKVGISSAAIAAGTFYQLEPGEFVSLRVTDANLVWVDSTVNGEGVSATVEQ